MLEIDVFRTAALVIKRHGEDAPIHAAMMADRMIERGDLEGLATWKRILKAVDSLLSKKVPHAKELY